VTPRSAARERTALWCELLQDWGYDLKLIASGPGLAPGEVRLKARRPEDLGVPVTVEIWEVWLEGVDPDGLSETLHGCHRHAQSWHAQLPPGDEQAAERLDLDRRKPKRLYVHRHPLGEPNDERVPSSLVHPDAWLEQVEHLVYEAWDADELKQDEDD